MRFNLGRVVMTRGFVALYGGDAMLASIGAQQLLQRHARGDWGTLRDDDRQANEEALQHGDRLLSKYEAKGDACYVITERDRSATTVMLVEEN